MSEALLYAVIGIGALVLLGILAMLVKCYRKVEQGSSLVRNGLGGTRVTFTGLIAFPILHLVEKLDLSVKRIEINRAGPDGLVCKDNMRADVKVAFFVRVNPTVEDVKMVSQSLGCVRASDVKALVEFFDAKFSEALKTVGKQFDFVELYTNRDSFKNQILKVIGTDLNGYVLDDAAIDYLEQTPLDQLNPNNILDAEGIKKITDLTAQQAVLSNRITREKEKTLKKQDVEAREAILNLERQQVDAEQKQAREIVEVTARETAEGRKVAEQERLKSERARISTDEEIAIADENRLRQIVVARKAKERTELVEEERVRKDQMIEATEKERAFELAQINKEKAVEVEKKNIQDVIRERVTVERTVVEQEERIKDTRDFAAADRARKVAVTRADQAAEEERVKMVKIAEGRKEAAALQAEQVSLEAEGRRLAAEKDSDAKKVLAQGVTAEQAASGLAEADVMRAKADASLKQGTAEADVMQKKYHAEAEGITEKAKAMKLFDSVGKEHEEFKLRLHQELDVKLAEINKDKEVAVENASVVAEALRNAKIDIVGGETTFFDKIVGAVTNGKQVDRMIDSSRALTDVRRTFFSDGGDFKTQLREFVNQFGVSSEDLKNLTISALLLRLAAKTDDAGSLSVIDRLSKAAEAAGFGAKNAGKLLSEKN